MKTLYLDCSMGAAGDMLTAALLELLPDPDSFIEELNHLGIPGVQYVKEPSVKCGITGTHVKVFVNGLLEGDAGHEGHDHVHSHHHDHEHDHDHDHHHDHEHDQHHDHEHEHDHHHDHGHHHHSSLHDIEHIVDGLMIPEEVKADICSVYRLIAEAESHVHGVPVPEIHFHEVGTLDAVADITAVCLLFHRIAPDSVVASPVHVGSGQVKCAHGTLPVPAPATAYILQEIPMYSGSIRGELCTPTGAALLKHFVSKFGPMPAMRTKAIGYGMGNRDFEAANCVRVLMGETDEDEQRTQVLELSCNVDDMTAEEIGFAMDRLFEAGAVEVYTIPLGMKKSRPGTLLRAMCMPKDRERILAAFFRHTSTIGVREVRTRRYVLHRQAREIATPWGPVREKTSSGYGVTRQKYEYDDLSRIAAEQDMSLEEVRSRLENL